MLSICSWFLETYFGFEFEIKVEKGFFILGFGVWGLGFGVWGLGLR
jgi:hypothetical protein